MIRTILGEALMWIGAALMLPGIPFVLLKQTRWLGAVLMAPGLGLVYAGDWLTDRYFSGRKSSDDMRREGLLDRTTFTAESVASSKGD